MAKTMLLPAAIRYLGELAVAGDVDGVDRAPREVARAGRRVRRAIASSRRRTPATRRSRTCSTRAYVQNTVVPAMAAVREVADQLERVVPDSLWPLPKYSEILFIK